MVMAATTQAENVKYCVVCKAALKNSEPTSLFCPNSNCLRFALITVAHFEIKIKL